MGSYGGAVRLSEFDVLVVAEFGRARGDAIVADHVLQRLRGLTAAAALEAGDEPRDIWLALCQEFDVPAERRFGPDT